MKINLDDFTVEEIQVLNSLGSKIGLPVSQQQQLTPIGFKIVKSEVTCVLCKTVTTQYIKLNKYSNGTWLKEKDITSEESESLEPCPREVYIAKTKSCWACERVLLQKEKTELVQMILRAYAPVLSKVDIIRLVVESKRELRKERKKDE